jgi:hypothetical protein
MRVVDDKMQEMHVPHFLTIQYMTDKPVTEMKKYSLKLANELMLYSNVSRNLIIWSSGTLSTSSPWFHRMADANATRTEHPAMMETF